MFDAAERSGAILFFDEADALFGTRTEVRDSHDRYANVEINYLLQRMEDYGGLAILATNRRAALDQAFLRRLRFVIEFPFPERGRPAPDLGARVPRRRPSSTGSSSAGCPASSSPAAASGRSPSTRRSSPPTAGEPIGMPHLARAAAREYAKLSMPVSAAEFGDYYAVVAR